MCQCNILPFELNMQHVFRLLKVLAVTIRVVIVKPQLKLQLEKLKNKVTNKNMKIATTNYAHQSSSIRLFDHTICLVNIHNA